MKVFLKRTKKKLEVVIQVCQGGTKEFKWVLNKSERIVGKSIFWKPDKERNVGYAWKKYFGDNFFL